MSNRILNFLDPRVGSGLRLWHYVTAGVAAIMALIVKVVIVLFVVTAAVKSYQYFEHHYRAPQPVAPVGQPLTGSAANLPADTTVKAKYLPPIWNQGYTNYCECFSTSRVLSYQVQRLYGRTGFQASPRFPCDYVLDGDTVDGTNPLADLQVQLDYGLARMGTWPMPPDVTGTRAGIPGYVWNDAAHNRYSFTTRVLWINRGAGWVGIDRLQEAMLQTHGPQNVSIPTGQPFYQAGVNGGWVIARNGAAYLENGDHGGHGITLTGIHRNWTRFGITGWATFDNSWGIGYGDHGIGYMPLQVLADEAYYPIEIMVKGPVPHPKPHPKPHPIKHPKPTQGHLQTGWTPYPKATLIPGRIRAGAGQMPWHQPAPFHGQLQPLPPGLRKQIRGGSGPAKRGHILYVRHIYAKDLPKTDMAPVINAAAHHYHLGVAGLLAQIGAECGLYTHSTRCDRLGGGLDYSFGDCQVSVATAAQFGHGNGVWDGYWGPNATRIRTYENGYSRCIWLAARVDSWMSGYESRPQPRGNGCPQAATFPALDTAWNAGPNQFCSFLLNPTGQAGTNHQSYLSWYRWAQSVTVTSDPYAPRPRPKPHPTITPSPLHSGDQRARV